MQGNGEETEMDGKKDEKRRNGKNGKELVEMEEGKGTGLEQSRVAGWLPTKKLRKTSW